jgi:hypothetical protein
MPGHPHALRHALRRHAAAALSAAALGLNAGCYSYAPVATAEAPPGKEIRVTLSEQGAAELARFLGPRAASLEGRVVTRSDSGVTLSVTTITRANGVEETWPGDQVAIPRAAVAAAQARRVARTRSLLLTAAIIAGGILVGAAIRTGEDVNRGPTRPGGGGTQ